MTIVVELFARVRELAGRPRIELELPAPSTLAAVRRMLIEQVPEAASLLNKSAIAVNECYAGEDTSLRPGDRVAVLPPVSGG
jgi:molybdopterin converting factor subunit 1